MSRVEPHSRLISETARTVLGSIEMFQKGRSRIWLDDHEWWVGVVEFQPSGWSKGSYLNVSVMWLWYEADHISFDFSFDERARVQKFISFEDETQFVADATRLASAARDKVLEYRRAIRTCKDAADLIAAHGSAPWLDYHSAVAYACASETRRAKAAFERLDSFKSELDPEPDWVSNLLRQGRELAGMLNDASRFRKQIDKTIQQTRSKLKLPEVSSIGLCGSS